MKLSVVIPVYNGAEFIAKSYQSIMGQQLQEFEIIYIDNNSQDRSVELIKELVKDDSRVKLLMQSKQGASPTRNLGISKAIGDYIYLFDVDDEIFPNALNRLIHVLDEYPEIDAVFGKMIKSYKGLNNIEKPENETHKVDFKDKPFWGLKWFSSLRSVVGPPAFLYRREVFDKIGLFNEEFKVGEDTAFDIKLGMMCNLAYLDTYIYLYFKHQESTMQVTKQKTQRAFMVWPRLVKEHLPFYLNNKTPLKFKQLLFAQIYKSMGKQLFYTKEFKARKRLKRELINAIEPIHLPGMIRFFLSMLVIFPVPVVIKIYGYYIVPFIKSRIKE